MVAMLVLAGLLLGVVFQLAHAVEQAEFRTSDELPAVGWHEWQVRSTVDFCHGRGPVARMVTWYTGGLNYQTEHHLFPSMPRPSLRRPVSAAQRSSCRTNRCSSRCSRLVRHPTQVRTGPPVIRSRSAPV